MWLPQMIGVAPVLLGIASFQTTFSVVLQRVGRSFSLLIPFRFGPRHCGQFSASIGRESAEIYKTSDPRCRNSALLYSAAYHSDCSPASNGVRMAAAVAARDAR